MTDSNNTENNTDQRDPLDMMVDDFMDRADGNNTTTTTEDKTTQAQDQQAGGTGETGTTAQSGTTQAVTQQPKPGEGDNARPNNQGATQNQETQPIPEAARKFGDKFFSDRRGNVYDATGNLIAPSGNPHKLFRKMYGYIEAAEVESAGLKQRLKTYEDSNAAARAAGLTADEYVAGISLMTAFKKDPKAAVQFLLQQAVSRGTDVSDIIQGGAGLNESTLRTAVQEIVAKALEPFAPFVQQRQSEQQLQEMRAEAEQEYNGFMQSYPDAAPHQAHIARVMEETGKPMVESYFFLKTWALENGLNWKEPLGQQVEALKARHQNGEPNGGGNNHRLPDLNGRTGSDHVVNNSGRVASADDSWESIIKASMSEARQAVR